MNTTPSVPHTAELPIRRSPLPDYARNPLLLLLVVAIPQSVLMAMNLHSFYLMAGEMNPDEFRTSLVLFACELLLLFGTGAFAAKLLKSGASVPWKANWAIFLPHAGYLVAISLAINEGKIIPASVRQWIVPEGQFLFHQWVFVMPAVFYSVLALSCFPTRHGRTAEVVVSIAVAAGIPVLWYASMQVLREVNLPGMAIVVLAVLSGFICLGAFLRLVTCVYVWADRGSQGAQFLLALVVGLAGPLGGLALNAKFPFPTDFQSPLIYVLAAVNGLLLMFPTTNHLLTDRIVWLCRCAMWPFTAYFFFVFLPFLPLAIPAMIFVGAGFLILVPVALMIVHTRAVLRTGAMEMRDGLGRWAVVWAIGAVSLFPAGLTGLALADRVALHRAMDYVFTPNYRSQDAFDGSLWFTRRALEHLRDQKSAAYMPFLTEFYDQLVFGGLTLSIPKMQAMHETFFGFPMSFDQADGPFSFRNRPRMAFGPVRTQAFPRDVKLTEMTTSTREEEGGTATTAVLNLENQSAMQSEYVVRIQLPPGVVVSGYWLHVGVERVPGRIFEKKTALWVYQMIRDVTRRDPGVLVYTGPDTLELRVFPFAGNEKRVTEIEFLTPPGMQGTVEIGERSISLSSEGGSPAFVETASRLVLPEAAAASLPEVRRRPYLHFIVDRSAKGRLSPEETVNMIKQVAPTFSAASAFRVTAANYEFSDVLDGMHSLDRVDDLSRVPESRWLEVRGGFLRERAIKRGLLRYVDEFAASKQNDALFGSYPIFVVLSDYQAEFAEDGDLAWIARQVPDADGYYLANGNGGLTKVGFDGFPPKSEGPAPRGVRIFRAGGQLAVTASEGSASVPLAKDADPQKIEVYDPEHRSFEPVTGVRALSKESRYARGVAAIEGAEKAIENPSIIQSRLPGIIKASRDSGVLVPSSAYIVVENSAQWKMLKAKEGQKLRGNKDLDFMESPEPSISVVALLAGLFIVWRGRSWARKSLPMRSVAGVLRGERRLLSA
jgi:hypothetical protein